MNKDELLSALAPVIAFLPSVDPKDPAAAAAALNARFPLDGDVLRKVRAGLRAGVAAGTLCERTAPAVEGHAPVQYGRLAKDSGGYSIDAVHMEGPGASHTHVNGEIDLCFDVDDKAPGRFEGSPAGWTVFPPGSWHVPTVTGGKMDILYFLPGGGIVFGPKP